MPAPTAELASLPTDVRLPDRAAWLKSYRKDCSALKSSPCELTGDLDGDHVLERVIKTRSRSSKLGGVAVHWGTGGISIIGAGTPSRQLRTDVSIDRVELEWAAVEDDLSFVTGWKIVSPNDRVFQAPGATGAGIWLDGGDAAEVLYWDGSVWRRLIVGF